LFELEKEKTKLTAELDGLKENDPQALADLEKEQKLVVEAAHRWTDNIFTVSFILLFVAYSIDSMLQSISRLVEPCLTHIFPLLSITRQLIKV
jgi:hypothetical protein